LSQDASPDDGEELERIEALLGYRFEDRDLLRRGLTHRSYSYERKDGGTGHYERLEFLGDALLGFVVAYWLHEDDPEASEGVLSRRRQSVVRAAALASVVREMGLDGALRLGRGEEQSGGRRKPSLLADLFEAVLGAIYVDGGLRPARAFVRRHLGGTLRGVRGMVESSGDFKTRLQERVQAELQVTPRYRIVSTRGPDHAREFEVEVLVGGRALGRGTGTNRKRAEQAAARVALGRLERDPGRS
jgi:ribonuclease-3